MRLAALTFTTSALLPVLLAGCFDSDFELDLGNGCFFGSPCVTTENPVVITQDENVLALGGTAPVEVLVLEGFQLKLRSTNPSVIAIDETAPGVFAMRGLAEGTATIEATDGTPNPVRIFDAHTMSVEPIAKVEFNYQPNGDGSLARLAALPNSRERVHVTALTGANQPVAGGEGLVALDLAGVQKISANATEVRMGDFNLFGPHPSLGFDIGVAFGGLGQGSIAASVNGQVLATLPIDIIPTASAVELRPSVAAFAVGAFSVVGLVGTDAQGVPVAGLVGNWSASPADRVDINTPNGRGETFVIGKKAGVVTLTATLPDGTQASHTLTIE